MKAVLKYVIVLALMIAAFHVFKPSTLTSVPALAELGRISINIMNDLMPANTQSAVLVDQERAGRIDEELDYRIAQRVGSLGGWRAFLAAHENGKYAQTAVAEVRRLEGAELEVAATARAQETTETSAMPSQEAKVESSPSQVPPVPENEVAVLSPSPVATDISADPPAPAAPEASKDAYSAPTVADEPLPLAATSPQAHESRPSATAHKTASPVTASLKPHVTTSSNMAKHSRRVAACAACSWRGRERLIVTPAHKLFALFPLRLGSAGANIALR
jgi:hypothetical protein